MNRRSFLTKSGILTAGVHAAGKFSVFHMTPSFGKFLKSGLNTIEIKVVTAMGNYMKSLTGNPIARYWTNEKTKIQPVQSMGLIGPVTMY